MARHDLPTTISKLRDPSAEESFDPIERQWMVGSRLAWIVSRVLSLLPADSRCLIRSVTLSTMLARRGIPSRVVIGVRAGPDFAAHAWVEHRGDPLLPTDDDYLRLHEV
jgi:Transglutaminase-like superfamily